MEKYRQYFKNQTLVKYTSFFSKKSTIILYKIDRNLWYILLKIFIYIFVLYNTKYYTISVMLKNFLV